MAWCDFHWFSNVLRKQVGAYVLLPDTGDGPFPVFYLLHGLSDDYTIWLRRSRIEPYVRGLPLIVVMPDGFRGFYTNNEEGPAFADYMARELPEQIERSFPAVRAREGRAVGGLSMGGYGALRLGLGFPDRYVSVVSHSGALLAGTQRFGRDGAYAMEFRQVFGDNPAGSEHDLPALAKRARERGLLPKISFDCGTEDSLIEDNRTLHRELEKAGIPHAYHEYPGSHTWDYWDARVQEAIRFHCEALGIDISGT